MKQLQKELEDLAEVLSKTVEATTKDLGKKSLDYMAKQYSKNNMSGHIGNINLKAYNKKYKYGFVISSGNDEVAVYNEFGTGVVGEGTNPLADETGYQYNLSTPYKGMYTDEMIKQYVATHPDKTEEQVRAEQTPDTWWYWKNGTWRYTEGMKGKNMYASLVDELRDNVSSEYKTKISQTIGSYGGK